MILSLSKSVLLVLTAKKLRRSIKKVRRRRRKMRIRKRIGRGIRRRRLIESRRIFLFLRKFRIVDVILGFMLTAEAISILREIASPS